MEDNKNTSLSTSLLENQGKEGNEKKSSQVAAGLHGLRGTQGLAPQNPASWTLAERGKVIKAMLDQEMSSQQRNGLEVDQYDLILTEILTLERLRPADQRLSLDQIFHMLASIFKKTYAGDKFEMIMVDVRELENDSNLKKTIQKGMESNSDLYKETQEPYQPEVLEEKYEDIMEVEITALHETEFLGHTSQVNSVIISANGKFLVSGSDDCKIKIWNIKKRKEEITFTGHTACVLSVALSADGRFIVSGSHDHTIKVWNLPERREECTFTGHTSSVTSVALSADGRFIASGSWDETVKVWNVQERREECTFTGHTGYVNSVAVSTD